MFRLASLMASAVSLQAPILQHELPTWGRFARPGLVLAAPQRDRRHPMLIRQSAAYLVANGASAALGFLAVVLFTQLLDPADYGAYVIANSTGVIVADDNNVSPAV